MMTADQIVAAHKAQLTALHDMSSKALATVEKIAQLNLQASKATLDEHTENAHALLSAKDIKELTKLQRNALQPLAEKAASYNRHLFDIAAGLGAEFSQLAEAQMTEAQNQFVAVVESTMKYVPLDAEPVVAAVRSALSTAASAMDSVHKAVKQATVTTQADFTAMADSGEEAAKPPRGSKAS